MNLYGELSDCLYIAARLCECYLEIDRAAVLAETPSPAKLKSWADRLDQTEDLRERLSDVVFALSERIEALEKERQDGHPAGQADS